MKNGCEGGTGRAGIDSSLWNARRGCTIAFLLTPSGAVGDTSWWRRNLLHEQPAWEAGLPNSSHISLDIDREYNVQRALPDHSWTNKPLHPAPTELAYLCALRLMPLLRGHLVSTR
jgi:hypothetical protein